MIAQFGTSLPATGDNTLSKLSRLIAALGQNQDSHPGGWRMATDFRRKEALSDLTDRIVDSYRDLDGIHHLGHCPLPSRTESVSILCELKEVLYPGYRHRQQLHLGNVTYFVGDLVDGLHDKLTRQIARALRHEDDPEMDAPCGEQMRDYEAEGQDRAIAFLEYIPELRDILASDVQAAYDGDPAAQNKDEVIFCYPGLEAITNHRIAHKLHDLDVPLIPRIMSEHSHAETGIDIHPGATIGRSFFIDHGTGVVVGGTCVIEDNVKLYQGVTLGALSFPKDENGRLVRGTKRHPTIERGTVVYANATILGGDTVVGANSVIGASVWLMKSVPPNTVVTLENPNLRFRDKPASAAAS